MDSECGATVLRRQLADPLLMVTHPVYRPLLWTLSGCVLLFVGWATWAQLDEVTHSDDRVVSFSCIQKIQSPEGGVLDRLLVKESDLVEVGQPLMRLDGTHFFTNSQESANQASVLCAAIIRLDAEVLDKKSIEFPSGVDPEGPLARFERRLFKSRHDKLVEGTQATRQQIHLAQSQLDLVRSLVIKRVMSQVETFRLSRDTATLSGKLAEPKSTHFQDAYTKHAQHRTDLNALEPITRQRQDQLRCAEILSPVHGRANAVLINTRSGVVQPGEPITEVTPVEERLLVEARIKPRDVVFLVPDMPARVKIAAYDYIIYGGLKDTLKQISTDTIEKDVPHGRESYYQILTKTDNSQLKCGEEALLTVPGMVTEIDILSGKRSMLDYLLRPLIKTRLY